jgi:lipopolysaccharide/colanic/teichoic acid biosynthesis glycosyltransferase
MTKMQFATKRAIDLIVACIVLIVICPVLVGISVIILANSGRPVLFVTERVGHNFSPFRIYKFRTMVKDAHAQLPLVEHLNLSHGMIKIRNDPRVTSAGRWLRRFSLDELPQFFNVVRGDMSLVGPRPYAANELSKGNPEDVERLKMRPGLTGMWQVAARSDPRIERRLELDLEYVRQFSILLDIQILLKTIPVVLSGKGDQIVDRHRS